MGAAPLVIRVVLDTNVVVSALLFRGAASRVHAAWRARRITLLVSGEILSEYFRVLAYPKFALDDATIQAIVDSELLPHCEVVQVPESAETPGCRDPDDDKFLHCAVAGAAELLVTGDGDLLDFAPDFRGVPIVSLNDFSARLARDEAP